MGAAAFIICDTFSSRVIRETRSSTRFSIGSEGSLYGGADSCPLVIVCDEASHKAARRRDMRVKPRLICFIRSSENVCNSAFRRQGSNVIHGVNCEAAA